MYFHNCQQFGSEQSRRSMESGELASQHALVAAVAALYSTCTFLVLEKKGSKGIIILQSRVGSSVGSTTRGQGFEAHCRYFQKHSDFEVEDKKNEFESETNEADEAWKQTLESFKEEAKKMKEVSQEAYEVYSKKAMVILKETSETLKIQAEKARLEMTAAAKEINKEGKVYLDTAAKNSPDSVKDIVETFVSSTDELKGISTVRDFYVGIPYGAFLAVGGFLSFMLTGSISAIRFGVILGCVLLALSVSSLRSWKSGQSSELFLKAQAAIVAVIFIREWRCFCQKRLLSTLLMTLISGSILVFYVYRIITDGKSKGPSSEQSSE